MWVEVEGNTVLGGCLLLAFPLQPTHPAVTLAAPTPTTGMASTQAEIADHPAILAGTGKPWLFTSHLSWAD